MDSVKDRFVPQMITEGGKFRLTFADGATGKIKLSFGDKSDWSWADVEGTIDNGKVEISYDAFSQAWGAKELSNLWQISVVNNVGTVTNLKWLGNTALSDLVSEDYKVKLTLSEPNQTIANDASESIFTLADQESVFNYKMITSGGKFRLTFSDSVNGNVGFVYQDANWGNWDAVTKNVTGSTVEITYDDLSSWIDKLSDLAYIKVQNKTGANITITKLEWLGNTEFSALPSGDENLKTTVLSDQQMTVSAGDTVNVLTIADAANVFKTSMILPTGKFRIATTGGTDVHLVLKDAWTEITGTEVTVDGTKYLEFDYATCLSRWKECNSGSEDFSNMSYIQIKNNSSNPVTIDKVEWLGPKDINDVSGGDEPDPPTPPTPGGELTKDENGVVTIPNNQGDGLDFTGYITSGGYFRVEYTLNNGTTDAGIQLTMEPNWVSVSEASLDKDGKSRKGKVDGNTYYAEFSYADCEKVWKAESNNNGSDLDTIKKVFPQYSWNGPSSDTFKAAIASYTVKYYPTDTKAAHPLGDGTAVVGTLLSTDVSGKSYQWYRVVGNATVKGTAINGATSASYTPTADDKGCWLYCVIDSEITAGPAAVVMSKTNKTTSVFNGSKSVAGGDSTNLWTPSSASSTFNKAMIVPNGSFRMKCDPASTDVKLVLKEPWKEITGRVEGEYLVFDYDALLAGWAQNFGNVGEIDVKNTGSSSVTITSLEWTGYDIGVEETPYLPTDRLPFGGDTWTLGWQTGTITENEENNLVTANVKYDYGEWSTARIQTHSDTGFIVDEGIDTVSLDVYIEKTPMDTGKGEMLLSIVDCSGETKLNTSGEENTITIGGSKYYRTTLNIKVSSFPERFHDFILAIRGKNTNFDGKILVENITLRKYEQKSETLVDESSSVPLTGSGSTKTTTVEVNTDKPKVYGDDTIEVTIRLSAKPTTSVRVKTRLNDNQKTDALKDIPADDFKHAARSRTVMATPMAALASTPAAVYLAGETWEATTEIPVPCVVNEVTKVQVDVIGAPNDSTVTLTKLVINHTPPKTISDSNGGGGGGPSQTPVSLPHTWEFKRLDGWKYEPGWNSDYSGTSGTNVRAQDGRMVVNVDYSRDGDKSWSQMAVTLWHNDGMSIQYATHVSLDLYYLPEKLNGSLALKLYSGGAGIDTEGNIKWDEAKTVKIDGSEYKKVRVDFDFSPIAASTVHDMALCLIGRNTTYRGPLLIGDLTIEEAFAGSFVMSKRQPKSENSTLRVRSGKLVTASGEEVSIPDQVTLADGKANGSVRSVYAYLQAIGSSKDVLFGQQYNFGQKAGSANLSDSDTYDIVGDYSAIYGLDALALAGSEFSASRCNQLYGTPFPSTAEGNVVAAAYLTNTAIKRGAIVTLSCHMPNFSQVGTITPNCSASYARYDFSGYTPNVLTGDTANEILPGGKYNVVFNAYLDMIADYANRVDGAVLFRPFHENTGSWFWWGKAFCDAETYKNIYRYTVEYLRDEKGVHNFLYVYGPGSEAESLADYAERYPGDSYVDMVGFDMYNRDPDVNSNWMSAFKRELDLVSQFAVEHGKLVAVTETGAANTTVEGDRQTALLRTGNKDKDWFNRVLDIVSDSPASYLLVWANFGQTNGFYTPYVIRTEGRRLYGHEMMDNFINYYNDARSIFASDQKRALGSIPVVTARAVNDGAEGYITSPVSGRRILNATEFTARVTNSSGATVQFILHGKGKDITLTAKSSDGIYYSAQLSKDTLESLGSYVGGSAELIVDDKSQQTIRLIYNIPDGQFTDVPSDAWFYGAVEYVAAKNIMSGVGNDLFEPDSPMTRAMMVQVLYNMEGRPETDSQGAFQDVPDGIWYSPAVSWAVSEKIASGYCNTEFGPEDKVTREQMTVMLYNYAKLKQYNVSVDANMSVFTDVSDISSWALEAVRWANGTGLLNGMGDNTLAPGHSATRAQLASVLMRFCKKIA